MKAKLVDFEPENSGIADTRPSSASDRREDRTLGWNASAATEREESKAVETPPRQAPANEALAFGCLVVGRDVKVAASVTVPGSVRVEGRIDGRVEAAEIIVLPGGMLVGEAYCVQAVVHGTLRGEIHCAEQLTVLADANIEGEVNYAKDLLVEAGAILNCTVSYRDEPTPIRNIIPALDEIAHTANGSAQFSGERELARDAVPLPASFMKRLLGSSKA